MINFHNFPLPNWQLDLPILTTWNPHKSIINDTWLYLILVLIYKKYCLTAIICLVCVQVSNNHEVQVTGVATTCRWRVRRRKSTIRQLPSLRCVHWDWWTTQSAAILGTILGWSKTLTQLVWIRLFYMRIVIHSTHSGTLRCRPIWISRWSFLLIRSETLKKWRDGSRWKVPSQWIICKSK